MRKQVTEQVSTLYSGVLFLFIYGLDIHIKVNIREGRLSINMKDESEHQYEILDWRGYSITIIEAQ